MFRLQILAYLAVLGFISISPASAQRPGQGRRLKVLFLGHKPGMHTGHVTEQRYQDLFAGLGPQGVDLDYTDEPSYALNRETLARYDALALYANWEKITPEQERALFEYVESGHGFVPIHCASYCFLNSLKCTALMGGRFKSHNVGEFDTQIVKPDHPIMRGFKPFKTWDETYVHEMHNPDKIVLQTRVGDNTSPQGEPWTWVRTQGKGRVFYTAYGHNERTWRQPGFHDLMFRGILWAVGDGPATALKRLNLKPLEYVEGALVPNYERREPAPKLQKPLTPQESQPRIYSPAGLDLNLFASEKDGLWNVIEFKFDEQGRMWTCESRDYPNEIKLQGEGRDRIRILEDSDGDGKVDKATVFAEGLSIPSSLVFANDGVIVLNIPDTTFLKDTNGDGKADERRVLLSGWGTGDTHASASSIVMGFDGWIYGCVGYSGFRGTVGNDKVQFGSGAYRFKPDGSKLEFLGSTSNNTWGFALNENGDIFGSTANNQSSWYCAIPRRYYETVPGLEQGILPGVDANKKVAYMREYIRQVDVFGGFTAAACHNFYTARLFPKAYWNTVAFVAEPTCHVLYQGIAKPEGSHFSVENGFNLLASDDEWFAPVYADVGPEGAVYVSDFYSFLIQHNPTPSPRNGGFQATTGKGNAFVSDLRDTEHARVWRVMPSGAKPGRSFKLSKSDPKTLLEALRSDNLLWRRHAQRLLVERGNPDVVPPLKEIAADQKVDAVGINGGALGAIWTLAALGEADAATLTKALSHPAQGVRRAAAQNLPRTEEGLKALVASGLLDDKEPLARLTALLVLSEMPSSAEVGTSLLKLAKDATLQKDRWLPVALTIAAAKHAQGFLAAALADAGPSGAEAPKETPLNLLPNSDFEAQNGTLPKAWAVRNYSGQAEHTVDAGRNGGKALKITSAAGSDTSWFVDVPVEPNSDYLLTGWIKTENLSTSRGGRGAMLELHQLNGAQPHSQPLKGNQEWTQVALPFNSGPQREISINLLYGGWGHATGSAWWDDLSLTKTKGGSKEAVQIQQVASAFSRSATPEARSAVVKVATEKKSATADLILQALQGGGAVANQESVDQLRATHQIVRIGVVTGQFKYDKAEVAAKPDKPVVLVLTNPDEQPHNIVVGKPGTIDKLDAEAMAMMTAKDGFEKSFVPAIPEILASTRLANKGETVFTKLPALAPGDYPIICTFPGHSKLMRAVLKVSK